VRLFFVKANDEKAGMHCDARPTPRFSGRKIAASTACSLGLLAATQVASGVAIAPSFACKPLPMGSYIAVDCPELPAEVKAIQNDQLVPEIREGRLRGSKLFSVAGTWQMKYLTLMLRLKAAAESDKEVRAIENSVKAGRFHEARSEYETQLKSMVDDSNKAAAAHFDIALLDELVDLPLQALLHYEEAFRLEPENSHYGRAYGVLLRSRGDVGEAESVLSRALSLDREQVKSNRSERLADLASTLRELGSLYRYSGLRRPESQKNDFAKSAKCYAEALQIYRELSAVPQSDFRADIASTQANLGMVQMTEKATIPASVAAFDDAVRLYRGLAKADAGYSPQLANELSHLADALSLMGRYKSSGEKYREALEIYRALENSSPSLFQEDIGIAFDNLGVNYVRASQYDEAVQAYRQALNAYDAFAKTNPSGYRKFASVTLNKLVLIHAAQEHQEELIAACSDLRRMQSFLFSEVKEACAIP
jgi:tetratricopeptide (TPR) repeat protein